MEVIQFGQKLHAHLAYIYQHEQVHVGVFDGVAAHESCPLSDVIGAQNRGETHVKSGFQGAPTGPGWPGRASPD